MVDYEKSNPVIVFMTEDLQMMTHKPASQGNTKQSNQRILAKSNVCETHDWLLFEIKALTN